mmetsp:Transcript_19457/g.42325  ORF Transcript_19457/g.42325 Transcript_19457/m.42325 type:complete len:121 (-) Transcript_19457:13-375(-)
MALVLLTASSLAVVLAGAVYMAYTSAGGEEDSKEDLVLDRLGMMDTRDTMDRKGKKDTTDGWEVAVVCTLGTVLAGGTSSRDKCMGPAPRASIGRPKHRHRLDIHHIPCNIFASSSRSTC